ncbi:MAG TPA: tripartite tricarboxylate transporter TctB family protein [Xanthobacteraceae bacterium]|jgi:hypothetical protein|nr:tripartite tricarboxylate transporter TctB family protein [Xanthobacteraceae bacterium]
MSNVRAGKDFWSGVMFIFFAAVGAYVASGYSMGRAGHMGPGYFPLALALVLGGLGAVLVVRALLNGDEPVERLRFLPLLLMVAGVVAFGLAIQPLGLVISLIIVTIFAALAGRQSGIVEIAAMAAVLAAFSVGIFHYVLLLPIPIWPTF